MVLISPQYVRPYVRRDKTDRADVKGLLEAFRNGEIEPVPVKTVAQQQLTSLHRVRSGWMAIRTAQINALRGLLRELGLVIPAGARHLVPGVQRLIEDAEVEIPDALREVFSDMCVEIRELESRVRSVERRLEAIGRQTPGVERLRTIPGVGLLTSTALVGFVGDVQRFRSGRHFSSYLGLTPRERSSGGRRRLGGISKRGDRYLRTLLIHGARAVLWAARSRSEPSSFEVWALRIQELRGHNKAAVAVANRMARQAWAVWKRDCEYQVRVA